MRAYILRLSSNPALADDLMQEVFLRLLRTPHPPLDPESGRKYVFTIATNLARDWYRQSKRNPEDLGEVPDRAVEPIGPWRLEVNAVLQALTARERQLLWLAYAEGFSHMEIAEITGLKPASIRPMLFYARRKAADQLRTAGYQPEKDEERSDG